MLVRAANLKNKDVDPYVLFQLDDQKNVKIESQKKKNTDNPEYAQEMEMNIKYCEDGPFSLVNIEMKDDNLLRDSILGYA